MAASVPAHLEGIHTAIKDVLRSVSRHCCFPVTEKEDSSEDGFNNVMFIWLINTAHQTAARLNQPNPQCWAASCVSTRCKHIRRTSSTKGVFVLHFHSTAHRQECLRGKQQWLAGAPRLLLAFCPSGAGTQPEASYRCQVGH